jgi:hypothetical protein
MFMAFPSTPPVGLGDRRRRLVIAKDGVSQYVAGWRRVSGWENDNLDRLPHLKREMIEQ